MLYINGRFLTQEMTGVQRFAEEISRQLNKIRNDVVILAPEGILNKAILKEFNVEVVGRKSGHYWEQVELPYALKKKGSPLLLNLCSTAPAFYQNQIVTHHDVTYKRYPSSFSRKFRFVYGVLIPRMLKSSRHLLTVSEFSKEEIHNVFGYPKEKISIIYNAVNDAFAKAEHKSTDRQNAYLLAVSSPNYHKNFHGMLSAFETVSKEFDVSLKIIGKTAVSFSQQDFSALLSHSDKVEFMGRVDDQELINLYQNALAFVFPSFYEGFGIPPLEAQSCGCPVISSNAASMPEVLQDSVIYFDPNNIAMISDAMKEIISDSELRTELTRKGNLNLKRFSWHASAQKVSDIVDSFSNDQVVD
ncbi:glycosyltransferase family 4 protein [Serratia sp. TSA_198.1]|uniref:glycosyltransferase family 4 protein n=1 Tax=Serratia sp. TSA_198.1 TaxID=3415664 RepID=UPI00404637D7